MYNLEGLIGMLGTIRFRSSENPEKNGQLGIGEKDNK
jgi:hypothetical protein